MAFVALSADIQAKVLEMRPGPGGTVGMALASDLLVNDFVWGARAKVVSLGATTSGVRTVTLDRKGVQFTVGLVATSSLWIIRP